MSDCVFCEIVEGTAPAHIVYDDAATVAFLDTAPATAGHTLVVPKLHVANLWEATDEIVAAMAVTAARVAELLRDRLACEGLNLVQANGRVAWQEVPHLHTHVVPRYRRDDLTPPWRSRPAGADVLTEMYARLRR